VRRLPLLVDGERICLCLALAVQYEGLEITIEGVADADHANVEAVRVSERH
jgi:aerobic-type carbon monoxide dehydrogenase small subunit (CoxS/CutS family)